MSVVLTLLAALGLAAVDLETRSPELALIHVEANVGNASGGHSALRVDNQVYHFQRTPDGLLLLVREEWIGFRHVYAGLQNRSLHLAHLRVEPEAALAVAERFSVVYVRQLQRLRRQRRLGRDRDWWAALRDGGATPALRGAGLLAEESAPTPVGERLRDEIAAQLGAEFLAGGLASVGRELADLRLDPAQTDLERLRELLLEREVLRALGEGRGLATGAAIDDFDPAPLSPAERLSLEVFSESQRDAALALLESARPDRGFALAVAVARFHAALASLEEDRMIVLDVLPGDARRGTAQGQAQRDDWSRVGERALAVSREIRAEVLDGGPVSEARFNLLEEAMSRGLEARFAARGASVRLCRGRQVPARGRSVALELRPVDVRERAERAARLAREGEQELIANDGYSLLDRNCVTELYRTLNAAFPDETAARLALGHCLAPDQGLAFIPRVAHGQVTTSFRIARLETVLSHRRHQLARLEADRPGVGTALRESFVPTSTLYTPRDRDGTFLFFTDEASLMRPVFGVLNLGSGLLTGVGGLLTLPFDRGERVTSGLHGAFFSLPELVFSNVRKGSYGFIDAGTGVGR